MERQRRNSLILAAICVIGALGSGAVMKMGRQTGSQIVVSVDGVEKGRYSLSEEREIEVKIENIQGEEADEGTNVIQIRDGKANIIEADCPDQLCVYQKAISKVGEMIVCLPNKIVIEVEGTEKSELDAIVN